MSKYGKLVKRIEELEWKTKVDYHLLDKLHRRIGGDGKVDVEGNVENVFDKISIGYILESLSNYLGINIQRHKIDEFICAKKKGKEK